jgi:autotransporter-associated beta strand protein
MKTSGQNRAFRRLHIESLESRQMLSGQPWPSRVSVPYVDATAYPAFNLAASEQASGNKYYTLAFIVAGSGDEPAWGGQDSLSVASGYMRDQISALRALGGDVAVSLGGAAGQELADVLTNATTLQADYQSVVTEYGVTRLDFDIEGAASQDYAAIDLRSQVLASLQQANAAAGNPLQIWLTLPVLPSGLTSDGIYAVQSAVSHGVNLSGVNIMTMDYGDSAAPNPAGQMGTYAIDAAQNTFSQLQQVYSKAGISKTRAQLWSMIGITPMIGVNDQQDEVFDQSAANQVLSFAQQNSLGELAFWSATRDYSTPSGQLGDVSSADSGITQSNYQFTQIFAAYDLPTLSINNVSVTEGSSGTRPATFTVTLSAASTQTMAVNYATADGSATAGAYYTAAGGTLSFAPGVTQKTITVSVIDNPALSTGTQFTLQLSNASGATIGSAGTCTIINPNAPVQISVAGAETIVNSAGTGPVVFSVTLNRPLNQGEAVSVHYATADGTAKAGVNYAVTQGTLTFTAGQSLATVSVPFIGGLLPGSTEQFSLLLSDPVGATLAASAAAGIIEDNDPPISVAVTYQTTDDWGTGFNGQINITNNGSQAINTWQLAFDFPYQITSSWSNFTYTQTGNRYVINNVSWNGTIAAGQTLQLGFGGSPGKVTSDPTTYVFNGVSLSPPAPLTAGASNWTSAGLTLTLANDGNLHLYKSGTTTDAVTPLLATTVSNVQVVAPASTANTLTVDFSSGNPIPSGGVVYSGGQSGGNKLLLTGTPSGEAVTISGPQISVGGSATVTTSNVGFLGINVGSSGTAGLTGGNGLVKSGPGELILSGTNSVSGNISVAGGTLVIATSTAVPSGTGLTVGAGASSLFGSAIVAAPAVASAAIREPAPPASGARTAFYFTRSTGQEFSGPKPSPRILPAAADAVLAQVLWSSRSSGFSRS